MDCTRGSMEREVARLEALNPGSKCAYIHGQLTVSSLLGRAFGFKSHIAHRGGFPAFLLCSVSIEPATGSSSCSLSNGR